MFIIFKSKFKERKKNTCRYVTLNFMLSGNDDIKFPIIKEININNLASETKIPVSILSL